MSDRTRSLELHLSEIRRANRAVYLEMASIVSFIIGLALAVTALWPLVYSFSINVIPEDNDLSLDKFFQNFVLSRWGITIAVLTLLNPAALLMSAGVVVRHFFEKK